MHTRRPVRPQEVVRVEREAGTRQCRGLNAGLQCPEVDYFTSHVTLKRTLCSLTTEGV